MNEKNPNELESEIEREKEDLRNDFAEITRKAKETQDEVSPKNFLRDRVFLFSAVAFAVGFFMGYGEVPIAEFAEPAVRTALKTAAEYAGSEAVSRVMSAI